MRRSRCARRHTNLDRAIEEIANGTLTVPTDPSGTLLDPDELEAAA